MFKPAFVRNFMIACAFLCPATSLMISAAHSQEAAPWADQPYNYVVLDQDVRDTLKDFGNNLGLPVSLTDGVRGRVAGRVQASTARGFLDALAKASGLIWYYDGSIVHVSMDTEFQSRVIPVSDGNASAVVQAIKQSGMYDLRFGLRAANDGTVITVSGPPGYIAMVEQFASAVTVAPRVNGDDPRVRVFRGNRPVEVASTFNAGGTPR